jgi:signal transduction histidine kinase
MFFATFIFLIYAPKRNKFFLRVSIALLLILLFGYFYPIPLNLAQNFYYGYLRQILFHIFIILMLYFIFDIKLFNVFMMTVAAYSLQQIVYSINNNIEMNLCDAYLIKNFKQLSEAILYLLIYLVFFLLVGPLIKKYKCYEASNNLINIIVIIIFLSNLILSRLPRLLNETGSILVQVYTIALNVTSLLIQLVLYRSFINKMEFIIKEREKEELIKQYQTKKETIDAINSYMHDLKRFARNFENKSEGTRLKELIDNYEGFIKTGCERLDVLLADYFFRYKAKGIKFLFYGDASNLNHLDELDFYSLIGNLLDNAIEASLKTNLSEKNIELRIIDKGGFVNISLKNFYNGIINMKEGELHTTKVLNQSLHGKGVSNIKRVLKKYDGSIKMNTDGNIFQSNLFLEV